MWEVLKNVIFTNHSQLRLPFYFRSASSLHPIVLLELNPSIFKQTGSVTLISTLEMNT